MIVNCVIFVGKLVMLVAYTFGYVTNWSPETLRQLDIHFVHNVYSHTHYHTGLHRHLRADLRAFAAHHGHWICVPLPAGQ